jgi:hypothetical protein
MTRWDTKSGWQPGTLTGGSPGRDDPQPRDTL